MANFDPDATYIHEGFAIDYTPGADMAAGDVVDFGTFLGVAVSPLKADVLGALQIEGVYSFKKDGTAMAVGDSVGWDGSQMTAVGADGVVVKAAASGDSHVWVKLTPTA